MKTHPLLASVTAFIGLAPLVLGISAAIAGEKAEPLAAELSNRSYTLTITGAESGINARLVDHRLGLTVADGPYLYRAQRHVTEAIQSYTNLEHPALKVRGHILTLRGQFAGLDVEHSFTLPPGQPFLEERIRLHNPSDSTIELTEFEAGFQRRLTDVAGQVLPELSQDRWVAVPLRARATDPKGHVNDFSARDLVTKVGYEPHVNKDIEYTQVPSRHRHSEAWAWTHGDTTLGIFSFNQQNLLFSVLSTVSNAADQSLRFGGACMLSGEPAALTRLQRGQTIDLGTIRYQTVSGGYTQAAYAYRKMLDENGCRFPRNYNPPVHWEQLYDMTEAWTDRAHRYTKAIVEKEAAKGRDYSCEALYLDPGWDTDFGTFYWGEAWLGPRRDFVQEMRSVYGLKLALHCPLATWMSHEYSWGLGAVKTWPAAAERLAPSEPEPGADPASKRRLVPALREGRRNLALLPAAKPNAASVFQGGAMAIHQVAHLNDGWYGNSASWIADRMPAWAELDLGGVYEINEVRLGNDHLSEYTDRAATEIRVLISTNYNPDSGASSWQIAAQSQGQALQAERRFQFTPVPARWVRVELLQGGADMPRLDEIEIYEARSLATAEANAFSQCVRRGPAPKAARAKLGPLLCLGSRQYLDEAAKRLLANCADGAVFLMFDGNWWNGGCLSTNHGHPVPYRIEDQARACLDLAQRVHARYPRVLIEMHDPVAGGSPARITPVYYKYGLPGSYDENWGFELMWNPLEDLREARGRSLYYYNLGCNVPIYLHIDLRKDYESCVVLWWFASTCRHLGIGGTSPKPAVVAAQQQAMRRYRELERFFKRGEFYGINEEIHLHVLPKENAFVVNLFNLSDETRQIGGSIELATMGLKTKKQYRSSDPRGTVEQGQFKVSASMTPWSAQVMLMQAP